MMKYAILIAVLILGIISLFTVSRNQGRETSTEKYDTVDAAKNRSDVSADPETSRAKNTPSKGGRAARKKAISDCLAGLIASSQKSAEFWEQGRINHQLYGESTELITLLIGFSPSELRSLVKAISETGSLDNESKLRLIDQAHRILFGRKPEIELTLILAASEIIDPSYQREAWIHDFLLPRYAKLDPVAAGQWLIEHQDKVGEISEIHKQGIIQEAAGKDIHAAMNLIEILKMGQAGESFGSVGKGVTFATADTFITALRNSNASDAQRDIALGALNESKLFANFEAASEWLDADTLNSAERNAIISSFGYEGVKSPEKWLTWLTTSGEPTETQSNATERIIKEWAHIDYAATGEWINAQPDSQQKNDSIYSYAETLAPYEPASAAEWANTLPVSEDLPQLIEQIYRSFQKKDPEAAAAFAAKHGLE